MSIKTVIRLDSNENCYCDALGVNTCDTSGTGVVADEYFELPSRKTQMTVSRKNVVSGSPNVCMNKNEVQVIIEQRCPRQTRILSEICSSCAHGLFKSKIMEDNITTKFVPTMLVVSDSVLPLIKTNGITLSLRKIMEITTCSKQSFQRGSTADTLKNQFHSNIAMFASTDGVIHSNDWPAFFNPVQHRYN